MKSISFYLRFLTYVLIFGTLPILIKRISSLINFDSFNGTRLLMGAELPNDMGFTTYCIFITIYCAALIFLIYHLNTFRKVVSDFYNDLVFSDKNGRQLKTISFGIILFTIVLGTLKVFLGIYSTSFLIEDGARTGYSAGYLLGRNIGRAIYLMLPLFSIALILRLISELILKGAIIQTENDLTI